MCASVNIPDSYTRVHAEVVCMRGCKHTCFYIHPEQQLRVSEASPVPAHTPLHPCLLTRVHTGLSAGQGAPGTRPHTPSSQCEAGPMILVDSFLTSAPLWPGQQGVAASTAIKALATRGLGSDSVGREGAA